MERVKLSRAKVDDRILALKKKVKMINGVVIDSDSLNDLPAELFDFFFSVVLEYPCYKILLFIYLFIYLKVKK